MFKNLIFCKLRIVTFCPSYNAYARPLVEVALVPLVLKLTCSTFCPLTVVIVCETLPIRYRVTLPPCNV